MTGVGHSPWLERCDADILVLARHAEKVPGRQDYGLTPDGVAQARQLAQDLLYWRPEKLFSSPYPRAAQTASIVGEILGLHWSTRECLVERKIEPPAGTGAAGFKQEWAKVDASRDYIPTSGEASRSAGRRLEGCLRDIAKSSPGRRIAVITHGGVLRDFLLNLMERRPQDRSLLPNPFPSSSVPHARLFVVSLQGDEFMPVLAFPSDQPSKGR